VSWGSFALGMVAGTVLTLAGSVIGTLLLMRASARSDRTI